MTRWTYLLFSVLFLATANLHSEEGSPSELVKVNIIQEEKTIQAGRPFWVAVHLNIADKWHSYWKNPGEIGLPTSIEWELPEGYTASDIAWPSPQRFANDSIIGFGYEGDVVFLTQIIPTHTSSSEPVNLKAKVSWLICSDSTCMPGEAEATVTLTMSSEAPIKDVEKIAFFASAREKLPNKNLTELKAFHREGEIEIPLQFPVGDQIEIVTAYFFPEENQIIDSSVETVLTKQPSGHKVSLKAVSPLAVNALKGTLVAKDHKGLTHAYDIEAPIQSADNELIVMADSNQQSVAQKAALEGGLLMALGLALAGGMLLNLMPCVLPVISFKILGFVKMAGQSRGLILKHGLMFSAGVLVSFWVLAGVLLGLQSYGESLGWGFQLQEPIFVAILATVLLILSLSLFGVFELGTSVTSMAGKYQAKEGMAGSFMSGVLATAVATPCTGPFLGSAVGFAFAAPAWAALLVFTFLGIGMSSPYILLSAYPKMLKFVPKPGPWMITFKEIMGFLMLGSVLWLSWVFGAQTTSISLTFLLGSFLMFAMGCWIYGKWGTPVKSRLSRWISIAVMMLCFGAGAYGIMTSTQFAEDTTEVVAQAGELGEWEKYSPERVAELQKQGVPVIVDFTAKWCLICQVNHLVLVDSTVSAKMKELGVVKMKADWTKRDPMITKELSRLGRNSVPLYLLYTGSANEEPHILPQVLTPEIVVDYLNKIEK